MRLLALVRHFKPVLQHCIHCAVLFHGVINHTRLLLRCKMKTEPYRNRGFFIKTKPKSTDLGQYETVTTLFPERFHLKQASPELPLGQHCLSRRHDALPLVIKRFRLLRHAPGMPFLWLFVARQHCLRSAGSLRLTWIAVLLTSSNGVWIRLQSTFAFVFS